MRNFLLCLSLLVLVGCSTTRQPGLGERDLYVVNTPEYPDNRVYYLGKPNEKSYDTELLTNFGLNTSDTAGDPVHGEPLSIIVNSASLPLENIPPSGLPFKKKGLVRDIAVILDISAENQGQNQSIAVWYQRGVYPGQALNFSNLLIFHQESWDDSVAPLIRIRIMDVAAERNLETREALANVSNYGGSIALALQNPALSPIISIATRAASLVLANRENSMLLDYSIQFYKSARLSETGSSYLTPLKTGRFVLVGRTRDQLSNREFWRQKFYYDELNGSVISTNATQRTPLVSPVIVLTVNKEDMVVPPFVAAKSAYLTRLLTEATTRNLDEIQQEAKDLNDRVEVFVLRERVRRYRDKTDLSEFILRLTDDTKPLPRDVSDASIRLLRRITKCPQIEKGNLADWWEKNQATVEFVKDKFELSGVTCPETSNS